MRERATRFWPYWVEGAKALRKRKPEIEKRAAQRTLLFMGTFSVEPRFFEYAYHGGPLGELVQWTDLICSLYILGHDLDISANTDDLKKRLNVPKLKNCASASRDDDYDQIFTDYNGHKLIAFAVGPNHSQYRCKIRILDSFGTDAEFNFAEYSEPIPGGRSPWANADVNLRQIFTMFPHSPDNSFLGFVVDSPVNDTKVKKVEKKSKKPIGLVYGKEARFWKGHKDYLDTLSKYLEMHATTSGPEGDLKSLPDYVINHGILKGGDLQKLLDQSKVFIGLGFPYEGPAPLEAIAHGNIFLNAKLDPPQNRLNAAFFQLKPTFRALTSQHPYAETFIGEPHVFTVDIKNVSVVENTIKKILKTKVKPYLPLEWTPEGMLERISSFAENMKFCYGYDKIWPPEDELQLILGDEGISCKEACWKKGLLCESLFFNKINTKESFKELRIECDTRDDRGSLVMPAYISAEKSCVLQNHPLLFSCVASKAKHTRLCPCRDFQPQQVALCKKCT
ncbi:alpha-1,6-mannosylglycoprotein 6-beta-N-acetylglucosaminyltransferase A-like [Actinia tenebrosa]|uniref:alpha-1,6-mannosyl-glycoprotein 6-beta-N-acetylglucosaminyltransferase n=1 Tax=Actinia tenebrosa TaxID=6105 RepID=A0A6P8J484_ACTTE|nr:alpha-1,6-mannosylglycoprotein 6-beta-N-acetylglucosaminyltransferase A-like [Actinia tenebrosa]